MIKPGKKILSTVLAIILICSTVMGPAPFAAADDTGTQYGMSTNSPAVGYSPTVGRAPRLQTHSVTLTVRTTGGTEVQNTMVGIYRLGDNVRMNSAITDTTGKMTVNLAPGDYYLFVDPSASASATPPHGFYDGKNDPAGQFTVRADGSLSKSTFDVLERTHSVTLTVRTTDGTEVRNTMVHIFRQGDNMDMGSGFSDTTGEITVNLTPGDYYLRADVNAAATPPHFSYSGETDLAGQFTVRADGTLSQSVFDVLEHMHFVTLTVRTTDGTPVKDTIVNIYRQGNNEWMDAATTGSDGEITVALTPGAYYLSVDPNAAATPPHVRYDGETDPAGQFTVDAGGTPSKSVLDVLISAQPTTLTVRTTDGTPVKDTIVNIYRQGNNEWMDAGTTGSDGKITVVLTPGDYYLSADANSTPPHADYDGETDPAGQFTVAADGTLSKSVFDVLISAQSVTLTVRTTDGTPVQDTNVDICRQGDNMVMDSATTNGSGEITVALAPGDYYLYANANAAATPSHAKYSGETDPAGQFTVAADGTLSQSVFDVLISAQPFPLTVRTTDGTPVRDTYVSIYRQSDNAWMEFTSTVAGGEMTVSLAPGNYYLAADANAAATPPHLEYSGEDDPAGQFTVDAGGTPSKVVFDVLERTHSVTLTVRTTDGTPVQNTDVDIVRQGDNEWMDTTTTDSNGEITVLLAQGDYYLYADANAGATPPHAFYDGETDPAGQFTVAADGTPSQSVFDVLISVQPITLTVRTTDGTPVRDADVYVYRQGDNAEMYSAFTDSNGNITVALAPGDYYLYADANAGATPPHAFYDGETDPAGQFTVAADGTPSQSVFDVLESVQPITLTVRTTDGTPVQNTMVHVYRQGGNILTAYALTDSDGETTLALVPGDYYLYAGSNAGATPPHASYDGETDPAGQFTVAADGTPSQSVFDVLISGQRQQQRFPEHRPQQRRFRHIFRRVYHFQLAGAWSSPEPCRQCEPQRQ